MDWKYIIKEFMGGFVIFMPFYTFGVLGALSLGNPLMIFASLVGVAAYGFFWSSLIKEQCRRCKGAGGKQ